MTSRGREASADPPYTGALGTTRHEPVFVTGADGVSRRVDVVRQINAATDLALTRAALEGTLHRLDGGTYLAVPYIYHDPGARRFALVVPVARAHEEIQLRAELLQKLAQDGSSPIPAYVREARVVIGIEGLEKYLAEAPGDGRADAEAAGKLELVAQREKQLAARETELARREIDAAKRDGDAGKREAEVTRREERLRARAEEVTQQEDDLRHKIEELEIQRGDLIVREEELEQRLADLLAREESVAEEERALLANKSALQARERLLDAREDALERRARELDARAQGLAEREIRLGSAAAPAPAAPTRPSTPAPAATAKPSVPPPAPQPPPSREDLEAESLDAAEAIDEVEDVEPDEDLEPLPAAEPEGPAPAAAAAPDASAGSDALEAEELEAPAPPPAAAPEPEKSPAAAALATWVARGQDAYAAVIDGEVRMWARGDAERAARLAHTAPALVLQADPDSLLPLAVLSVTAERGDERFARVVLDVTRPDDRAVLETLTRDFRVRLEIMSRQGRALGNHAVAAQGEANAKRVLAVLAGRPAGSEDARRLESDKLARDGVRFAEGETFDRDFADEGALATASGTIAAVNAYVPLLDREKLDRLVLARGIPAARVDAIGKRVILAALRCGVELPEPLVARAVEMGVAADEKALCARALTAYAKTTESGLDAIGRSRAEGSRAWGPLLAWASRTGAAVPDVVRAAMRAVFDPDDPEAVPPPETRARPTAEAIAQMPDEELGRWADHAEARDDVAREMVRRDPARFAEPLSRALRLVTPDVAAELAAKMVKAGDALGDVWVELLGSRRATASTIALVATAAIRLRRGLSPLLTRALAKDSAEWKLFGWAAGEFGAGAVRAVGRLENVDPDRLAWVLAHAVRTGGGREVERVRTSGSGVLAEAATRAVGRVDEARSYDAALRQGPGVSDGERVAHDVLARVNADGAGSDARGATASEGT